jgi:hypothetical protein
MDAPETRPRVQLGDRHPLADIVGICPLTIRLSLKEDKQFTHFIWTLIAVNLSDAN